LPLQLVRPGEHVPAHAPLLHVWPPGHCVVQLPQNCGSVFVFTHAFGPAMVVHVVDVLPVQLTPHMLPEHDGLPVAAPETGPGQALPHVPQLFGSLDSLKQPAGQWLGKLGLLQAKPQLDIEQTAVPFVAPGQALPHAPQLATSDVVSTQAPSHLV
jgi:hypothetical protein